MRPSGSQKEFPPLGRRVVHFRVIYRWDLLRVVEVPTDDAGSRTPSPASPSTRERLDALAKVFPGFVVSTNPHGLVSIHSGYMVSPAVHLHEAWMVDATAAPLAAGKSPGSSQGGAWSDEQTR